MMCLIQNLLCLALVSIVKAGVFEKSFLVRIEDFSKANQELSETNKQLNQTVAEQKEMMLNMTGKMERLEEKNAEYEERMTAMNLSMSTCNCQNSKCRFRPMVIAVVVPRVRSPVTVSPCMGF